MRTHLLQCRGDASHSLTISTLVRVLQLRPRIASDILMFLTHIRESLSPLSSALHVEPDHWTLTVGHAPYPTNRHLASVIPSRTWKRKVWGTRSECRCCWLVYAIEQRHDSDRRDDVTTVTGACHRRFSTTHTFSLRRVDCGRARRKSSPRMRQTSTMSRDSCTCRHSLC